MFQLRDLPGFLSRISLVQAKHIKAYLPSKRGFALGFQAVDLGDTVQQLEHVVASYLKQKLAEARVCMLKYTSKTKMRRKNNTLKRTICEKQLYANMTP